MSAGRSANNADRYYTGNSVDSCFHVDRIDDLQVMDVENVIAVVGNETLAPDRLTPHLEHTSGDELLRHWQDFDWQREPAEHTDELGVVDDTDEASSRAGEDLLASQCAASAFDELQVLVAFIGAVDVDVQVTGLVQCRDVKALLLRAVPSRPWNSRRPDR